jgi:hypothetical protein
MEQAVGSILTAVLDQEFIGKHFPDAPGEEDCTKARPVKAKDAAADGCFAIGVEIECLKLDA